MELIIVSIGNLYLIAYLSHPNDNKFGSSIWSKISIWIGLSVAWLPFIICYFDVEESFRFFKFHKKHDFYILDEDYI